MGVNGGRFNSEIVYLQVLFCLRSSKQHIATVSNAILSRG